MFSEKGSPDYVLFTYGTGIVIAVQCGRTGGKGTGDGEKDPPAGRHGVSEGLFSLRHYTLACSLTSRKQASLGTGPEAQRAAGQLPLGAASRGAPSVPPLGDTEPEHMCIIGRGRRRRSPWFATGHVGRRVCAGAMPQQRRRLVDEGALQMLREQWRGDSRRLGVASGSNGRRGRDPVWDPSSPPMRACSAVGSHPRVSSALHGLLCPGSDGRSVHRDFRFDLGRFDWREGVAHGGFRGQRSYQRAVVGEHVAIRKIAGSRPCH